MNAAVKSNLFEHVKDAVKKWQSAEQREKDLLDNIKFPTEGNEIGGRNCHKPR